MFLVNVNKAPGDRAGSRPSTSEGNKLNYVLLSVNQVFLSDPVHLLNTN